MVRENMEVTTFKKVAEMMNGKIYCKKFSIKCAISRLGGSQFLGEKGNWVPFAFDMLL